jgi:integrase
MPKRPKARRQACFVDTTPAGRLRFRFRWKLPSGRHRFFSEATALTDTVHNRRVVERQAAAIGAEIRIGVFDYLKWFPNGNRANDFLRPKLAASQHIPTLREFYEQWIKTKIPPTVRQSLARDYRNHFRNYILDFLGDMTLSELNLAHLEDLRSKLRGRGLSEKTIRNAIDGSLRAMMRDAVREELPAAFPFPKLRWPERIVPGPSPFDADERDRILSYFRARKWKVGGFNDTRAHYPYYALLHTLFFTGMRPSEVAAVRVRNVNLQMGTIQVDRSRHLGTEAAPKTQRSRRTVRLIRESINTLQPVIQLKGADDHLFENVRGEPIEPANFYDLFRDAQRALGISPLRDLYSTKDTYISLALTSGVSLTWLSEQTGVAVATILKHYGRFVHSSETDALELSKIAGSRNGKTPEAAEIEHRCSISDPPFQKNLRFSSETLASPTGFEPVLPA